MILVVWSQNRPPMRVVQGTVDAELLLEMEPFLVIEGSDEIVAFFVIAEVTTALIGG
jgi:hypothetical protein